MVYLDDIIVMEETFDEHLKNLKTVFQWLREANLVLSSKKLFQTEMNYLDHIVNKESVAVDSEKVKAIQQLPVPRNKHQVRRFLGLGTYYRRYVPMFATLQSR